MIAYLILNIEANIGNGIGNPNNSGHGNSATAILSNSDYVRSWYWQPVLNSQTIKFANGN